jgi:hypothetical protein
LPLLLLLLKLLKVLPSLLKLLLLLLKPAGLLVGATKPAIGCSSESTPCCKPLHTHSSVTEATEADTLVLC